jgi:hypothetical protein
MLGHATHRTRVCWGPLLSRDPSRQCPRGGVSQSGRLQSLLPAALVSDGVPADAIAAESFSPGALDQAGGALSRFMPWLLTAHVRQGRGSRRFPFSRTNTC